MNEFSRLYRSLKKKDAEHEEWFAEFESIAEGHKKAGGEVVAYGNPRRKKW